MSNFCVIKVLKYSKINNKVKKMFIVRIIIVFTEVEN
jgi:hypothetical protein